MSRSSKRAKARNARRRAEAQEEIRQLDRELARRQRERLSNPLWYLADESYNRHVVHWEAGIEEANFDAHDEEDGGITLVRGDGRSMWYHPATRRANGRASSPASSSLSETLNTTFTKNFIANDQPV